MTIIIIIIYHLSFAFLFWMDGRMDRWMDGIYLPDHGQEHTSTNLKVLAWAFFFFVLFDMAWVRYDTVRYGYGMVMVMGMGMVYDFGSG